MAPADAGNARLFGQGADGTWDSFIVTTIDVRVQGGPGRAIALDELHVDARLMIAAVLVYVEGAIHGMRVQRNGGVQVSNAALTVVLRSAVEGQLWCSGFLSRARSGTTSAAARQVAVR